MATYLQKVLQARKHVKVTTGYRFAMLVAHAVEVKHRGKKA